MLSEENNLYGHMLSLSHYLFVIFDYNLTELAWNVLVNLGKSPKGHTRISQEIVLPRLWWLKCLSGFLGERKNWYICLWEVDDDC